jgi:cysteine desulfurase
MRATSPSATRRTQLKNPEEMLYLDNASTTRMAPEVLDAMLPFMTGRYGNASSIHGPGREARVAVETAREQVALLFDAEPSEIVFTSGGTEADVWAIRGGAHYGKRNGIVTAPSEHHAVLNTVAAMRNEGAPVIVLPGTSDGAVDIEALAAAVAANAALVSIMHVNNETGAVNPIEVVAALAKERGALFHCDAVQSAGKLDVSSKNIPFDFAVASSHKLHGPKGIGALFVRRGIEIAPMHTGGAQERGRRGGTENVPAIVGFGVAAEHAMRRKEESVARWSAMRGAGAAQLRAALPGIVIHGGQAGAPHILSCSFPWEMFRLDGQALLMNLDLSGLAVSSGSACTAGSPEPSHVIRAMGYDEHTAAATVRMSYGCFTTRKDAERGVELLIDTVRRMRQRQAEAPEARIATP